MKRNAVFLSVAGFVMIISGCAMLFITSFAKDVSDTKENSEAIQTQYQDFKVLIEEFNSERELVYTNIINELFEDHILEYYDTWKKTLLDYEKIIQKVAGYKDSLEKRCVGILYNDSGLQSKCDSMLISYETAVNYYVKDVDKFNSFIMSYNEGISELDQKEVFPLNYNYIDFNDDGKYLGK